MDWIKQLIQGCVDWLNSKKRKDLIIGAVLVILADKWELSQAAMFTLAGMFGGSFAVQGYVDRAKEAAKGNSKTVPRA